MEINNTIKIINGGVYLVINPADNNEILFSKLEKLVELEIAAVQIWDNFPADINQLAFIKKVCFICHQKNVPVLINNHWQILNDSAADGIHFDEIPDNLEEIIKTLEKKFIMGITVNNDLSLVQWANENELGYISFCSIFPSATSNSCELVKPETIEKARTITSMPIFLAGGIKPENMHLLNKLSFNGVAVVSGIMSAEDPLATTNKYLNELKKINNEIVNYQ